MSALVYITGKSVYLTTAGEPENPENVIRAKQKVLSLDIRRFACNFPQKKLTVNVIIATKK